MIDTANCVVDSWHRLGFQSAADMAAAPWLAPSELYQWVDDALKRLARTTSTFLTYDASIAVTASNALYALPAAHVFTESAWLVGGAQLRITPVAELFALDATPSLTFGAPTRISFDASDTGHAVIYPTPNINGTLGQIMGVVPPTVTAATPAIAISPVAQDFFTYAMIAGARGKESDSAMPEVAEHMRERMRAYESIFTQLWGGGRLP